jgi:hypothetical protein
MVFYGQGMCQRSAIGKIIGNIHWHILCQISEARPMPRYALTLLVRSGISSKRVEV